MTGPVLASEFSLLTLNTFAVPIPAGWWRLERQARELRALGPRMICLQEIQHNDYVARLAYQLRDYPDYAFVPRLLAPVGGLITFSRLPLEQRWFTPFEHRGERLSPGLADWLLRKGVLGTQLTVNQQTILVMNTHLQANYSGDWRRDNRFTRIQQEQVQQLADLVRQQPRDVLVIVCGDFNFPRDTFLYTELLERGGLVDPLAGHPLPTYVPFPLVPKKWVTSIDFMLVRPPADLPLQMEADIVTVENSRARWPLFRFLTDHRALTLSLRW